MDKHIVEATATPENAMLDELISDLELDATDEVVEETEVAEMTEAEEAALNTHIAKTEAYEEQAASADTVDLASEPVKAKREKKAKEPKAPRAPRDLNALPDSAFELIAGETVDRAAVMALRPTQKKIADKFDNIFLALSAGKKPSNYTMDCFRQLDAKKTITTSELVAGLKATNSNKGTGYTDGTARSQVGQFMCLAAALKIAERNKNTLTLNDSSALVAKLRAIA